MIKEVDVDGDGRIDFYGKYEVPIRLGIRNLSLCQFIIVGLISNLF